MAEFCMAIGLEAFALLLGLRIKDSSKGLSPHEITDRGPGATSTALSRDPAFRPVTRGTALGDLAALDIEGACFAIDMALKAVVLVTEQGEAIIKGQIQRALAHSEAVY